MTGIIGTGVGRSSGLKAAAEAAGGGLVLQVVQMSSSF